jgi:DNA-binding NarL/FixJ family response regulator
MSRRLERGIESLQKIIDKLIDDAAPNCPDLEELRGSLNRTRENLNKIKAQKVKLKSGAKLKLSPEDQQKAVNLSNYGLSPKAIATRLRVTEQSIKNYIKREKEKLNAND